MQKLAEIYRNKSLESIHYGYVYISSSSNEEAANFKTFTRSIIKPIQAKVALDILKEKLSDKFLAIAIASHLYDKDQAKILDDFCKKFQICQETILCGTYKHGKADHKSAIEHNCSGKHLALIAACVEKNWDLNYLNPEHPIQELIGKEIKRLVKVDDLNTATDGCGLQTYHMSLKEMANLFLNLINDSGYKTIIDSMNQYPLIIGGPQQIDSLLMQKHPGKFIAKGGAEGLMVVANLEANQVMVIKIIDGSNRAKAFVTKKFLEQENWIEKDSIKVDPNLYNSHQETTAYFL